jgi:uncharacterized membrane protein YcfT
MYFMAFFNFHGSLYLILSAVLDRSDGQLFDFRRSFDLVILPGFILLRLIQPHVYILSNTEHSECFSISLLRNLAHPIMWLPRCCIYWRQ